MSIKKIFSIDYLGRLVKETESEYYDAVMQLTKAKVNQAHINSTVEYQAKRADILQKELYALKESQNEISKATASAIAASTSKNVAR